MFKQTFSIRKRIFAKRAFLSFKIMKSQKMSVTVFLLIESIITVGAFIFPYAAVFIVVFVVVLVASDSQFPYWNFLIVEFGHEVNFHLMIFQRVVVSQMVECLVLIFVSIFAHGA